MPYPTELDTPRFRRDGGKLVIDVDWADVDSLRDYLRSQDIRTTTYLDLPNREANLTLWNEGDAERLMDVIGTWVRS